MQKKKWSIPIWLLWTILTSISFGIGIVAVNEFLRLDTDTYLYLFFVELAVIGLFPSIGQWLFLQKQIKKSWLWMPATALGLPLGFFLFYAISLAFSLIVGILFPNSSIDLYSINGFDLFSPIGLFVTGLIIGILQWLSIGNEMKNSLKWGLISALSWGGTFLFIPLFLSLNSFTLGSAAGLIIGLISGTFVETIIIDSKKKVA